MHNEEGLSRYKDTLSIGMESDDAITAVFAFLFGGDGARGRGGGKNFKTKNFFDDRFSIRTQLHFNTHSYLALLRWHKRKS